MNIADRLRTVHLSQVIFADGNDSSAEQSRAEQSWVDLKWDAIKTEYKSVCTLDACWCGLLILGDDWWLVTLHLRGFRVGSLRSWEVTSLHFKCLMLSMCVHQLFYCGLWPDAMTTRILFLSIFGYQCNLQWYASIRRWWFSERNFYLSCFSWRV